MSMSMTMSYISTCLLILDTIQVEFDIKQQVLFNVNVVIDLALVKCLFCIVEYKMSQRPSKCLKVALQILGRTFYKNTKRTSLYSKSLTIFIHKTPAVEKPSNNKRN